MIRTLMELGERAYTRQVRQFVITLGSHYDDENYSDGIEEFVAMDGEFPLALDPSRPYWQKQIKKWRRVNQWAEDYNWSDEQVVNDLMDDVALHLLSDAPSSDEPQPSIRATITLEYD